MYIYIYISNVVIFSHAYSYSDMDFTPIRSSKTTVTVIEQVNREIRSWDPLHIIVKRKMLDKIYPDC